MSWKIALALSCPVALGAALAPGCANDECTRADDLISNCASPDEPTPDTSQASMTLACAGTRLCQATCINQATCLEIEALQCTSASACTPLSKSSPASPLAACIAACSGGPDAGH